MITALIISIICLFIGLRHIPRPHIDRTACALVGAVLLIVCVLAGEVKSAGGAEAVAAEKPKQYSSVTVTPFDPRSAPRTFSIVVVCDTDASKTKGLQDFRPLKTNEAALFVFEKPEVVKFWMGSVAFPIDIVFIGPDKKVFRVYQNCRPGSRDIYPSGRPSAWVIETAVGSGIKVGDRVEIEGARVQGQGKKP